MFTFFKKKLCVDTSGEEIRRITNLLETNGIHYEIRTSRARGSIGAALDAGSYAQGNIPMYKEAPQQLFIYSIYVDRKAYALARKLVWGS